MNIGNDKYLHASVSCMIEIALAMVFPSWSPVVRFLLNVLLFGCGKEFYDMKHPDKHSADYKDVIADAIGAFLGEVLIACLVSFAV